MGGNPDWVFYHDDKPSEAGIMPRLIADFPGFRPRWEKHLELWKGEPAGNYNDIAEFAQFVVKDLYPSGNTAATTTAAPVTSTPQVLPSNGQTLWGRFIQNSTGKAITVVVIVGAGLLAIRRINRRILSHHQPVR